MVYNSCRTIEYVAQQLVEGYKSGDNITQAFLNNYDSYIFPLVNPDGKSQALKAFFLIAHIL
tara:strand:+ start:15644 stop:15829 length:186 start_codon:yes stop_codon:yes gene_type:complete